MTPLPKKSVAVTMTDAFQSAAETIATNATRSVQTQQQQFLPDDSTIVKIVKLDSDNLKQKDIAALLGCDESYVSKVLTRYSDKRILAKRILQAGSPVLAEKIIAEASPETCLKTLQGLSVIIPEQQAGGITIQVGDPSHPLQPPTIGTGKTS
jgi:hypothetical protein|tara:strand:- start:206 stop:664 length:459 start_codon:yes stop_codon:yes gene_type:complete